MVRACHTPQQPVHNHPSGHLGVWETPWSAVKMLDGQHQRADIPAHARTAHKGLLQKRLEEDLWLNWTATGRLCSCKTFSKFLAAQVWDTFVTAKLTLTPQICLPLQLQRTMLSLQNAHLHYKRTFAETSVFVVVVVVFSSKSRIVAMTAGGSQVLTKLTHRQQLRQSHLEMSGPRATRSNYYHFFFFLLPSFEGTLWHSYIENTTICQLCSASVINIITT